MNEYGGLTPIQLAILNEKMTHDDRAIIVDSDASFVIDIKTKEIMGSAAKKELVVGDHNSERFTFEIDRFIEGHDVLLCNNIRIDYSVGGHEGTYDVEDIAIKEDDEYKAAFTWLVSSNATPAAGTLEFSIKFECIQVDGQCTYSWSTKDNTSIKVVNAKRSNKTIGQDDPDILYQWKVDVVKRVGEILALAKESGEFDGKGIVSIEKTSSDGKIDTYTITYTDETTTSFDVTNAGIGLPEITSDDNGKHLEVVDGAWQVVEQSAGENVERIICIEEQTIPFTFNEATSSSQFSVPVSLYDVVAGEEYIVDWDGVEYTCVALETTVGEVKAVLLGNGSIVGFGENTGEPFLAAFAPSAFDAFTNVDTADNTHTVGLYQDKAKNTELPEVTEADNGKFLQVVGGKWVAVAITNGNEVEY